MNILAEVQNIFRDVFDDEVLIIKKTTTAGDIDDWDSFAQINLIIAIEKKFGIRFALEETYTLKDVGDMVDLISGKLQ